MSNQIINGGDLTVKCLLKEGITKIFGLVGGELLQIYDAIERWGREQALSKTEPFSSYQDMLHLRHFSLEATTMPRRSKHFLQF